MKYNETIYSFIDKLTETQKEKLKILLIEFEKEGPKHPTDSQR